MANSKIKMRLMERDVRQWELAKKMGISETTLYRRLREELPRDEQNRILSIVDEIVAERK